jgi:glutamate/tyrosine decarboxylase-like PLP-dependent enzyme
MPDSLFQPALEAAFRSALDHLTGLQTNPVGATVELPELRRRLNKPLAAEPIAPEQVICELVEDVRGGILGCAGGRFFAWAVGGSVPAALAADWLTSAWDQNAALYASGPAAAIVEEVAGQWLKDLLGLPESCSFGLVSGCQMAHATCLAAARHELLSQHDWDVERNGMAGAPQIKVLASNGHGSLERAVRLLGLGEANLVALPLDETERLRASDLEAALEAHKSAPVIVVLQAGDLNTGSFDRYRKLIPLAKRYSAWVHIDGAFGLWAAASPTYRHLLEGYQAADSWATDGHKWLNVPYDCGYAIVARPPAHRAAMSHRAPYLVHDAEARDQMDWNPEWSRRGRGFATYAALRQLGRQGVADLVDRCCEGARTLVEGLARLPGAEVCWRPVINQGLVRFLDPSPGASEQDHDGCTERVIQRVIAHGGAFFMGTTWRGRRAMRLSVMNWQTNEHDIETAIQCVADCLAAEHSKRELREIPHLQV